MSFKILMFSSLFIITLLFSFHVETCTKNIGNELKSPLDYIPFLHINPLPKISPPFFSIPFPSEILATFLTTSFPLPKRLRQRKKSKLSFRSVLQEKEFSYFRHSYVLLVCLCFLRWFYVFFFYLKTEFWNLKHN